MSPARLLQGKLPPDLLRDLLAAGPPLPPEVKLGPAPGEDACAIELPGGMLIAATDPITLTGSEVGAHAVLVNANDVAVMGVRPRWFLATALLPLGTREDQVRALFDSMRAPLARMGAALVGGHTEITSCVQQPLVVGVMLGLAEDGRYVATGGARAGDVIVQVGRAPIEGAAVLAAEFGPALASLGAALLAEARGAFETPGISIVEAALQAAQLGARAMHDPTEGGIAAGLAELAQASDVALRLDDEAILWFEPGRRVCAALGADPWGTLASGALLAAFPANAATRCVAELRERGFEASAIGVAERGSGVWLHDGRPLPHFARDEVARLLEGASR